MTTTTPDPTFTLSDREHTHTWIVKVHGEVIVASVHARRSTLRRLDYVRVVHDYVTETTAADLFGYAVTKAGERRGYLSEALYPFEYGDVCLDVEAAALEYLAATDAVFAWGCAPFLAKVRAMVARRHEEAQA